MDQTVVFTTRSSRERMADLAVKYRLVMFGYLGSADSGVLLSYGADWSALYKRAATLVDRILRGANPATIPVEQANAFELVVNLRTACALRIEVRRPLMLQATRVIE